MAVYKGWNAKIYLDALQIGMAESASVEIATGLEAYYQIGSRTPATLVEGNQEITGSISKAWINTYYLGFVTGTLSLTEFDLKFDVVSGAGSTIMTIYCYDCKFETGSLDIPQDGMLMEDYDFRAMTVAVV